MPVWSQGKLQLRLLLYGDGPVSLTEVNGIYSWWMKAYCYTEALNYWLFPL